VSRLTIVLCLVMLAALAVPSPAAAAASSIVFTKGGNVWLASPDGLGAAPTHNRRRREVSLPGAITRAGDKLAFVANVNGGVGNEIRPYFGPGNIPPAPPPPPPVARCVVPRLRGLGMAAARGRLVRAHCRLGQVRTAHSARGRHGTLVVISQQPSVGATRGPNTTVSIVLAPPARKRHHR
jgi:hypothetical protein